MVLNKEELSPILFDCYIDKLFSKLEHSGLGCHVGASYAEAFGYADDIALVAPFLQRNMIRTCKQYAKTHSITFNPNNCYNRIILRWCAVKQPNPNKSKLLCYNVDETVDIPPTYLNGKVIPSAGSDKHLGNYISTDIADRNIIDNVYDLYQRSNWVISDFRVCDSSTLDSLHRTYCMYMYGCELWDLYRNYVKDFKVAWRKIKRRIWKLPYRTHNAIVHNLSYNIDFQIDTRMIKFIHSCLNHSNIVCKLIVLSELYCVKSMFGSNCKYLSCKYGISQDDWYTNLSQFVQKVNMKCSSDCS